MTKQLISTGQGQGLSPEWYLRGRLRLRHLKLVKVLDETRNIGEAAQRMATTQPAISKMLGELEAMVRVQLFTRTSKGTFATPHGESLIRHARWILGDLDRAGLEWFVQPEQKKERVVLGVNSSSASFLVPHALLKLQARGDAVSVVVREGSLEALMPQLLTRDIDLIVARLGEATQQPGLVSEVLSQESMCVVCAKAHPLATVKRCDWKALSRYPWILPPHGSPVRAALDIILLREGVTPQSHVESASVITNMVLMDNSESLAVFPQNVAAYHQDRGALKILNIKLPDVFGPLGLVRHSHLEISDGIQAVINCLR
ncbi:MAG: LysR family transcriptional regulator [Pseudomonadota bacterium]